MSNTNDKPQLEYLHEYGLMEHPARELAKVKILIKDGIPCKCHKVAHNIVPSQIQGQYAKEYENCSTHCSRAQIVKSDDKIFFLQTCESIPSKFEISNASVTQKSPLEVVR